ncbi:MoaD/ThiS family protein [Thermodesulfovibrio sp. 3907-1M]|uniref:MoaD/ThiS family protein n=1 Tax=Thermodesulfovibrio autotrophicus TaxID=3118333 RepID=A0AAU8GYI7_9BACT
MQAPEAFMKLTVKLFGGIKSTKDFPKNEEGDLIVELPSEISVAELIDELSLNKKPFIVVLNGVILHDLAIKLKDGDKLSFFPPIAGGLLN